MEILIENIFDKYKLNNLEKEELYKIIYPIFSHNEFQRRLKKDFSHHSNITLGEHILEDAVVTYLLSKKEKNNYRKDLAIKIAMLHDLYTFPWQNSKMKTKKFFDKHGFRHPLEAVINSITWYPELFEDSLESEIIIDGILHHMYPLPVRYLDNNIELLNQELLNKIDLKYKKMILKSLNRHKIGNISWSKSVFKEGKVMAKADKKVSIKQLKNFESAKALVTGKNKTLEK